MDQESHLRESCSAATVCGAEGIAQGGTPERSLPWRNVELRPIHHGILPSTLLLDFGQLIVGRGAFDAGELLQDTFYR